ncbi:MAG: Npun_R2479 family HD domain-containing metalloprotein [Cyanobacteria bacterium P01_G01_bin.54]
MIQTTIRDCTHKLHQGYRQLYGRLSPEVVELLNWATQMVLESIAQSDAAYHDVEHTVLVTLTGQEILRGKQQCTGDVTPTDWLHCILSLLCHDIGYIKGLCADDRPQQQRYTTGISGQFIHLEPEATDASLTPYHVDRGKQFVQERFTGHSCLDVNQLQHNIELTRFPVPKGELHLQTCSYPGLVRAADLLGQLADPRYLQKLPRLFQEFAENGTNRALGYTQAAELRAGFPDFYWKVVHPYVQEGLAFLKVTQAGKQILANLYANICTVEYEQFQRQQPSELQQTPVAAV